MPSSSYERARREIAPRDVVLDAIEISHADLPTPARAVNDAHEHVIEGERYPGLPFRARLVDDVEGRAPSAEITVDNIGRDLTQWIELAQGGTGGTVRVMQVLVRDVDGDAAVEWELTLDVLSTRVDQRLVTVRLGFDPLLNRPAVLWRHDPERSPAIF